MNTTAKTTVIALIFALTRQELFSDYTVVIACLSCFCYTRSLYQYKTQGSKRVWKNFLRSGRIRCHIMRYQRRWRAVELGIKDELSVLENPRSHHLQTKEERKRNIQYEE